MNFLKELAAKAGEVAILLFTYSKFAFAACDDPSTATITDGAACAKPKGAKETLFGENSIFSTITTTLIFLVGAISVIMLIVGALRYVFSQGEASAVKGAKDTILYAIIGIIVAILAYAAVQFVISRFTV